MIGAIRSLRRPKQLARTIRYLPDRLLHAKRRRDAVAQLSAKGSIGTAVFICHGNINRSAYAAAAFAGALSADLRNHIAVRSAGFVGPERAASELAQRVALRRGVDLSGHISRLVDADELRSCDLIVVMSTHQRDAIRRLTRRDDQLVLVLGDLDSEPIIRRTVQDPYGHPEEVFVQVFDRIDRCVAQLVRNLPR